MEIVSRSVPFGLNGIIFKSRNEACKALGVSKKEVYRQMSITGSDFKTSLFELVRLDPKKFEDLKNDENINMVHTLESTSFIDSPVSDEDLDSMVRTFIVGGEVYANKKDLCASLGLHLSSVIRLQKDKDISFEEAVDYLLEKRNISEPDNYVHDTVGSVTYRGVTYDSIAEACRKLGLRYATIHNRMKHKGLSFEEAVKQPLRGHDLVINGIRYTSKVKACKSLGFNYGTVTSLMKKNGLTFSEAIVELMVRNKKKDELTVFGVKYNSIQNAADSLGVNAGSVSRRMKNYGESLETAVTALLDKRAYRNKQVSGK